MDVNLIETSPKLDWTTDNKIYDCYLVWKTKVELIFSSVLSMATAEEKTSYLRYWMGDGGIPLRKKWTAIRKLDFSNPNEENRGPLSGFKLKSYLDLLVAEFKPK